MNGKHNAITVMPVKLSEDIEALFPNKTLKSHAIKFVDLLMKKSWRENGTINTMTDVPVNYFRKVFSGHFQEWLNPLIDNNIIIKDNTYSKYKSISYSYMINYTYFYTLPNMLPRFSEIPAKTVLFSSKNRKCEGNCEEIKKWVTEDFKQLKLNVQGLLEIMRKEAEGLHFKMYKVNDEIKNPSIQVIFKKGLSERKVWMATELAIRQANEQKSFLIEDEGRYYIMDEYEFLLMKKSAIYIAYRKAILNMDKGLYFSQRNTTNNRLDTNFTNMANVLTKQICKDNNLIQFDLANAQFAILSDIFSKELVTEDFELFRQKSVDGILYEYVMEKLNIKNRKEAKTLVFQLLFSKETNNSPEKGNLRKVFPSVVEKIDQYKKDNGYNEFSIMLQKRESEIFIDNIWTTIKSKGMFCITKHDCIIIKATDRERVIKILTSQFKKMKFAGKIVEE